MTSRVLVVDNEVGMLEVCHDALQRVSGLSVTTESDPLKAARILEDEVWDLLISDIRMPGMSGVELVRIAKERDEGLATLLMTAFPSVDTAVEGLRLGASDYLIKPFKPDELRGVVVRLLEGKRLREEHALLHRQVARPYSFGEMVGQSDAMREVFDTIEKVSDTGADVLITGATGTGKELVARSVHRLGGRASGPFVAVDCGAIPENLLESEFFGYERGAFTGASGRSLGLMEFANKGSLFLDEVAELPAGMQVKLLRALQERKLRRLGGKEEIEVDIRIIAATSRDLEAEVQAGRFRADLYYRINVIRIGLPPLVERAEDIPLLFDHFVGRYSREMNRPLVRLDQSAMEVLVRYDWPGNVREFQNVVRRILAAAQSESIGPDGLPPDIVERSGQSESSSGAGFFARRDLHVARFEQTYFKELLMRNGGDMSAAAEEAGLPRGTLYRLLSKYDMKPADFRNR